MARIEKLKLSDTGIYTTISGVTYVDVEEVVYFLLFKNKYDQVVLKALQESTVSVNGHVTDDNIVLSPNYIITVKDRHSFKYLLVSHGNNFSAFLSIETGVFISVCGGGMFVGLDDLSYFSLFKNKYDQVVLKALPEAAVSVNGHVIDDEIVLSPNYIITVKDRHSFKYLNEDAVTIVNAEKDEGLLQKPQRPQRRVQQLTIGNNEKKPTHRQFSRINRLSAELPIYICSQCGKYFEFQRALARHMKKNRHTQKSHSHKKNCSGLQPMQQLKQKSGQMSLNKKYALTKKLY